jgi:integrase/recombinase XerD
MASITLSLFKGKKLKNGSHPLVILIIHNRITRRISIGHSLFPFEWDEEKSMPKKGIENYKTLKALIAKKLAEAEKILMQMEMQSDAFSVDEIKGNIKGNSSVQSFNKYTKDLIDGMYKANRIGNANAYRWMLSVVEGFTKRKEIQFSDINYKFLKKFEQYHLSKEGNSINGLNVYLREIRAVYNRAMKEKLVSADLYPFRDYKIQQKKTIKRAITKEQMQSIVDLELPEESQLWHARNFFSFSFFAIGMTLTDMAHLKVSDIQNGRINYTRKKTGKDYTIKVNEKIKPILDYYQSGKGKSDFIFPIIKRPNDSRDIKRDISNFTKVYNKNLKAIATLTNTDISINMTSYVARHSWASIANFSGVHIGVISQGMGHADIKTTQTYLADFDNSAIDDANENIL